MRILILGTGWVGTVTAAALAFYRHDVVGCDVDSSRISRLAAGEVPFHEPDLAELIKDQIQAGRLIFRLLNEGDIEKADVVFCCVATPSRPEGSANVDAVLETARQVAGLITRETVFVIKSTVPPGTARLVAESCQSAFPGRPRLVVTSNPEFLAESTAVKDALLPARIVVGADEPYAAQVMANIYQPWTDGGSPFVSLSTTSAEMTKYAANAFLATKVSFINEIAELCEKLGAEPHEVARGIGLDPRIGPAFLKHGLGYGGSCFPKDLQALMFVGKSRGVDLPILQGVMERNARQRERYIEKVAMACGGSVSGKRVAVLGLAYKPNTDDVRSAPALEVIAKLKALGAEVVVYDPKVSQLPEAFQGQVVLATALDAAVADADAALIATDWPEFVAWKKTARLPVIDGRP